MITGSLITFIVLFCGLLVSGAALTGGAILLLQNKERRVAWILLAMGALGLLATLAGGVMVILAIANWSM